MPLTRSLVSCLAIVPFLTASANAGMLINGLTEAPIRLRASPERSAAGSLGSIVSSGHWDQDFYNDPLLNSGDHAMAQPVRAAIPGGVRRLDVKSGSITNVVDEDIAYGASFLVSDDSRLVIAPDQHKERIRIYNQEKTVLNEHSFESDVQDLRFAGDGTAFVLVSNRREPRSRRGGVRRLDLASGQITNVFDADIQQGASLLVAPNGEFVIAPSQYDNRVKVLDEKGSLLGEHIFEQNIQDLQLADDGRVLVLVSNEPAACGCDCGGGVRQLDLATGCIETVLCADVRVGASLLVAGDGCLLIAPSQYDNRVRVYDRCGNIVSEHLFDNSVQDLRFAADGSVLALVNPADVKTSSTGIGLGGEPQRGGAFGFGSASMTSDFGSFLSSNNSGFAGGSSGGSPFTSGQPGGGTGMLNEQGRFPNAIQQAGEVKDSPLFVGSHWLEPNPTEFDDEFDPSETDESGLSDDEPNGGGSVSAVPEPDSLLLLLVGFFVMALSRSRRLRSLGLSKALRISPSGSARCGGD